MTKRQTVVAIHAHPDDESLLTGRTLAGLAADGHRTILIMATAGEQGLTTAEQQSDLGRRRNQELEAAARRLGVDRIIHLGYADSGSRIDGADSPDAFAAQNVGLVAARVAEILSSEHVDILIGYDPLGGYGHPDHIQVHRVAVAAADLAATPRLLFATVDRTWIVRVIAVLSLLRLVDDDSANVSIAKSWYAARSDVTHRIRHPRGLRAKRAALRCHCSQAAGGSKPRTVSLLSRLPMPIFALVAGAEWFVEPARPQRGRPLKALIDSSI